MLILCDSRNCRGNSLPRYPHFLAIHCVIILTFNFNPHLVNREKYVITAQTKYTKGIAVRNSQFFFDFVNSPPPTTQQQHSLFLAKRKVYSARSQNNEIGPNSNKQGSEINLSVTSPKHTYKKWVGGREKQRRGRRSARGRVGCLEMTIQSTAF